VFAFESSNGSFVIRFSHHPDDFDRDAFANRFRSPSLPIPAVTHRGMFGSVHYAISERVPGGFLDHLDGEGFTAALPSLLLTLDALRTADVTSTTDYGGWDERGNGQHRRWRDALRASVEDSPDTRDGSWRARLETSPVGSGPFDRDLPVLLQRLGDLPDARHVIHADLLNFNVFAENARISGVIDWGCAMYGDFLYDLAWFAFWWPWYPAWKDVDLVSAARAHYSAQDADIAEFNERMLLYQLQIGLTHQSYHATTGDWAMLEAVARRTTAIADEIR
jgi:hygromycin-B 4-O-kinase